MRYAIRIGDLEKISQDHKKANLISFNFDRQKEKRKEEKREREGRSQPIL